MKKLPPYCGECWFTNQQQFEKQAAGLLIDNTRFVEKHGDGAPDLTDRANNQYWIFWPREAASKNIANFGKYTSGKRFLWSYELGVSIILVPSNLSEIFPGLVFSWKNYKSSKILRNTM